MTGYSNTSMKRGILILAPLAAVVLLGGGYGAATYRNLNPYLSESAVIDEFNGVKVYFNGGVNQSFGRNLSADGYNLGIRYQCVEFIKRYYYERFGHKMPDAMGHAKSFFDPALTDGAVNTQRDLLQYANGSNIAPRVDDIIVFAPTWLNPYGHVAIVSQVFEGGLQVVQQNPGPFSSTRETFPLRRMDGGWYLQGKRARGWLRLKTGELPADLSLKDGL